MEKAKFKKIIEIYYEVNDSDDCISFDETKAITDEAYETIVNPIQNAGNPESGKIDGLLGDFASAYEQQGFILGFIYAMQLRGECDLLSTTKAVQV